MGGNAEIVYSRKANINPPKVSNIGNASCILSWSAPEGIESLHGYFVEQMCPDDKDGWSQLNEKPILSKTYHAIGLKSGFRYRFRISAATSETDRMSGHDTHDLDLAVTAKLHPPTISNIKPTSCQLSWSAPEGNGGVFVEQLRVDSNFGWVRLNETPTISTTYKVNDLHTGQRYRFRIAKAINETQWISGQDTDEIKILVRPDPPPRPTTYDVTERSCILEWKSPSFNGGSSVLSYEICIEEGSLEKSYKKIPGHCFSFQICGLDRNKFYKFKIRAKNEVGVGKWSKETATIYTTGVDVTGEMSPAVIDTRELEIRGMESVSFSFSHGVGHLLEVLDSIEPMTSNTTYTDVGPFLENVCVHADQAFASMKIASDKAKTLKEIINKQLQKLLNEQGQKEREMHCKEAELEKSVRTLERRENELEDLEDDRWQAEDSYERARKDWSEKRDKLENAKRNQAIAVGFGVGIMLVPVANIIASPLAAGSFVAAATVLEDKVKSAKSSMDWAEENRDEQKERCKQKAAEVNHLKKKISVSKREQDGLKKYIEEVKTKRKSLGSKLEELTKIDVKIRQCCSYVSVAKNRTEVVHDQLKFFYNISSIIQPLQEVACHLSSEDSIKLEKLSSHSVGKTYIRKLQILRTLEENRQISRLPDHQKDLQVVARTRSGQTAIRTVNDINDVYQRVSPDSIDQNNLTLAQHAGWEQFLGSAPLTIVLLSQIMRLSMMKDFPLVEDWHPPKVTLKFLDWPNSFRASTCQVAEAGWKAFEAAQSGMDQIRIYALTVPEHLKTALGMLENATDKEVNKYLQKPLGAIKQISDNCLSQAKHVEQTFLDAIYIMAELQEVLVVTKGQTENQFEKVKIDIKVVEEEEKAIKERQKLFEERKKKLSAALLDAESRFSEALASGPGTGKLLVMAVTDTVSSLVSATASAMGKGVAKVKSTFKIDNESSKKDNFPSVSDAENVKPNEIPEIDENVLEIYLQTKPLADFLSNLTSDYVENENLKPVTEKNKTTMMTVKKQINLIVKNIKDLPQCIVKGQSLVLCAQGISVCEDLEKARNSMASGNKELAVSITTLEKDVNDFFENGPTLTELHDKRKAPNRNLWKLPEIGKGAAKYELEKLQQTIELKKRELDDAREEYDKLIKKAKAENNSLIDLIEELEKANVDKMDFEQILNLIGSAIKEMANLREQWGKIVSFFQKMSNIIDCSMKVILKKFKDFSEKIDEIQKSHGYGLSHFNRDLLYNQIFLASETAYFVSHVAESYTEVSTKFLMPSMEQLPVLFGLSPETQKTEMESHLRQLKVDCEQAQHQIGLLMVKKKQEFDDEVNSRLTDIKAIRKTTLPEIEKRINKMEVDDLEMDVDDLV